MLCSFGHHVATCWVLLAQVWKWSNLSQQHPTCRNTSQHGGQTHATCCAQQCCDMLCWHVAIVWPGLNVFFGIQLLKQTKVTKFFGVYLDEHLTWKHHISFLLKQIAKSVGIIFRSRFHPSSRTKLALYYSLIYHYITYCNSTLSSTYVSNLNSIFYLQKRAVRILLLYSQN